MNRRRQRYQALREQLNVLAGDVSVREPAAATLIEIVESILAELKRVDDALVSHLNDPES